MERSAPSWFITFERFTMAVNRLFAAIAGIFTIGIVILVLLALGSRLVGINILWPYDVSQFILVYIVFLAMAPALESGHHVVVELFDRLLPRVIRPYVFHVAAILTILFAVVLFYYLYRATNRAFSDDRLAIASIAVPLKWVYVIGPIGVLQFILTAFAQLGRAQWRT